MVEGEGGWGIWGVFGGVREGLGCELVSKWNICNYLGVNTKGKIYKCGNLCYLIKC